MMVFCLFVFVSVTLSCLYPNSLVTNGSISSILFVIETSDNQAVSKLWNFVELYRQCGIMNSKLHLDLEGLNVNPTSDTC